MIMDEAGRARVLGRFGPEAAAWCDELPAVVARLAARWGLDVEGAMAGNTGRTLRCRDRRGGLVVLKLTPDREIAATEAAALRAWAQCPNVVDLLDADLDAGAIVLAGVVPGTPVRDWDAPEIDDLLAQLRSATPPPGIPTLTERVEFMFDLAERRQGRSLRSSREAALALAADGPALFVHGDLHPGNVLRGEKGVVAIDPRPCVGDPAFDAVDWAARGTVLPSLDPDRVARWCAALNVLLPEHLRAP